MIVDFNSENERIIPAKDLTIDHVLVDELNEWVSIYSPLNKGYTALYLSDLETVDKSFETLEELATYMHTEHGDGVEAFNNLQVDVKLDIKKTR